MIIIDSFSLVISVLGTIISFISLILTLEVIKETKEIQKKVKYYQLINSYNLEKLAIRKKLDVIYIGMKDSGSLKLGEIQEICTDLKIHEEIQSKEFNDLVISLDKIVAWNVNNKGKLRNVDEISSLVYEIKQRIKLDKNLLNED